MTRVPQPDTERHNRTQPAEPAAIPTVVGYHGGQQVLFIHTEMSDPQMAEQLTTMIGSPVVVVPVLADTPAGALADVYVFANGTSDSEPRGPLGFQADMFDGTPGDGHYSPLRAVRMVRWTDETSARLLRSAADVEQAERAGQVTIEPTGVVVNMPFVRCRAGTADPPRNTPPP